MTSQQQQQQACCGTGLASLGVVHNTPAHSDQMLRGHDLRGHHLLLCGRVANTKVACDINGLPFMYDILASATIPCSCAAVQQKPQFLHVVITYVITCHLILQDLLSAVCAYDHSE
jgi:hypothetical protein